MIVIIGGMHVCEIPSMINIIGISNEYGPRKILVTIIKQECSFKSRILYKTVVNSLQDYLEKTLALCCQIQVLYVINFVISMYSRLHHNKKYFPMKIYYDLDKRNFTYNSMSLHLDNI